MQGSVKSDLTGMANPTIKYKHLLKKKCKAESEEAQKQSAENVVRTSL